MSIPEPEQVLEGHCSAVNNNTLYVYSPSGLQSLQLKENATWVEEKSGTPVRGAACVQASPNGDAALYVIGGETDDEEYSGLQRYFFADKKWESLTPPGFDLSGRTNHSAAYLSDSQSILVYAGSTPEAPSFLSSQTFMINAVEPFGIESFTSTAAPANQPILLPWNETTAMMAGGSPFSEVIYTFDRENGWQPLGTNLTEPLEPGVRGTLIEGDDGSKVLETYDMISSPNKVKQTVLLRAGGETAPNGQVLGEQTSSNKQKRDLTLEDWPTYNSTNAPSGSRDDYAVARGEEGMVVISGGNEDEPVAMFDQEKNSWVDAGEFFGVKRNQRNQEPLQPSSTSSDSTPSATSSAEPEASTTEAAGGSGMSAHDKSMRTLGITLGTLCGIAALAILLLLYVRWRKSKNARAAAQAADNEKTDSNGARLSFVDRGASFMKEAGGSATDLGAPPRHRFDNAPGSHSSLAIMGGKFGNKRGSNLPKGSFESTTNLVKDRNGGGGEPVEMMDIGEKKHLSPDEKGGAIPSLQVLGASPDDRRTSGWSKYFSTSQPQGNEHLPAAYAKDRDSTVSQWPSTGAPSTAGDESRIPSAAFVPPLNVDFSKTVDGQRLSNVIAHSPSFADSREDLASRGSTLTGQQGKIEGGDRPVSDTNTVSSYDRSTMSSDYYNHMSSVNSPWTPFSNDDQRPSSSVYTASIVERRLPSRAARSQGSGFFPGAGATPRPPKLKLGQDTKNGSQWPASPSPRDAGKDSPLLNSPPPIQEPARVHDRASTATVFPQQSGNRWTANISRDQLMDEPLAPPRAPGLMGGKGPAGPAPDRASTCTVFPMDGGDGAWTANTKNATAGAGLDDELRPPGALGDARAANDRDSTVTMFPRGVDSTYYADGPGNAGAGKKPMNNDISWLNLDLNTAQGGAAGGGPRG